MKIACGQINPTIGDFPGNLDKVLVVFARRAQEAGCALVVFPELCLCGYPPMDLLEYDSFVEENLKTLRTLQSDAPQGSGSSWDTWTGTGHGPARACSTSPP